jgi:hypothetical protein
MQLIVPYVDEVDAADSRLISVAKFLGINCETLPLDRFARHHADFVEKKALDRNVCFVINPRVLQRWVGRNSIPAELVFCLVSCFRYLLVHGLRIGSFDGSVIAALSQGRLQTVQAIDQADTVYDVEKDTKDVCEAFSGLTLGPTNPDNDHVLSGAAGDDRDIHRLISIGGRPFMARMKRERTEILFLASEDVVDLDSAAGDSPIGLYFSRLLPQIMALRHVFGEECWRPGGQHACVIIDDPLLRDTYGFLDFERLFRLVEKYNFHTSIAFIPHNYRRNSSRIVELFRNNRERLSICFHGSDHTEAELASADTTLLNTILRVAEMRMAWHEAKAGFACDKVMVFPQESFSPEAMKVLKMRNFAAAVSTGPYPTGDSSPLTVREFIQPAILRYAGFPLFLRLYVKEIRSEDLAFNLFFGKPVLIVEHHEIFEHPELLVDVVQKVNSMAPGIHWSNLESAVGDTVLERKSPDGMKQVRAYASHVQVVNDSNHPDRLSVEWNFAGAADSVEQVLDNGMPCSGVRIKECSICALVDLPPLGSRTLSLRHRNVGRARESLGFRWNAKAFVRRRLSEFRDNYLSKNPRLLSVAQTLRDRYLS